MSRADLVMWLKKLFNVYFDNQIIISVLVWIIYGVNDELINPEIDQQINR